MKGSISLETIIEAFKQQVLPIQGHLDLEGLAYIKIVRHGKDVCFAQDVTSTVLRDGDSTAAPSEFERRSWNSPAKFKDWKKQ